MSHATGRQLLPIIAQYAYIETIYILASSQPLKLPYNLRVESIASNRDVLQQYRDYTEELSDAFEELITTAQAETMEAGSIDSLVESGLFISTRSSFHSDLTNAIRANFSWSWLANTVAGGIGMALSREIEWTKNGRYAGSTELELTPNGVTQVKGTKTQLVGPRKLIDPARIARSRPSSICSVRILRMPPGVHEIRARRKEKGLDQEREWNIWRDGCEGGKSMQQVTEQFDRLIGQIREIQRPYMNGEKPVDIVLVWIVLFLMYHWVGCTWSYSARVCENMA
ncbi:hypothetical protein EYZ11_003487 [Aspergillus tanneri]|uniref:Uncharacterized protein n=1 Tax=Aspergillus tanneri TaxID=1220188 RepID=A0A4V6RQW5_9EURO|nr:hypothetical protein EYZ11_003487 [Aspergillus tanneri]